MNQLRIVDKSDPSGLLKAAPFRKEIRKTEPHKHNSYLELVYLSGGGGTHTIDQSSYKVQPPVIFVVRKEQMHYWELTSEPEGFVLILKKEFLDRSMDGALKSWLTRLCNFSCLQVSNHTSIAGLFQLLVAETNFPVQEGLLKALFAKVLEVSLPVNNNAIKSIGLLDAFREILCQNSVLRNNVAYYAKLLNTTPQNLNAVCRKAVNLSAGELLSEYIINEAKRLLLYTDNSVAEIAFTLGFNDPSHFVKYFKRHTAQIPTGFRKQ